MTGGQLEEGEREFVTAVTAGAPEGWTGFELAVKGGQGGPECDGRWAVPGGGPRWMRAARIGHPVGESYRLEGLPTEGG